jgi:hypothetical protein
MVMVPSRTSHSYGSGSGDMFEYPSESPADWPPALTSWCLLAGGARGPAIGAAGAGEASNRSIWRPPFIARVVPKPRNPFRKPPRQFQRSLGPAPFSEPGEGAVSL